ncbi:hypothetical protein [Luteolibacter marinus]|uniref:hypothetical protein n=1 Tax=Luteolibacter marinus TaxID=2776705 RepID=UPI001868A9A5|nr:hypothetical protein [Luteolibacter marinus]
MFTHPYIHPSFVLGGLLVMSPAALKAGCCARHDAAEIYQLADAIGDYRALSSTVFRGDDGRIWTRHSLSLNESLKGSAPATLEFSTPGGRIGHQREVSSLSLQLQTGGDYILQLRSRPDGSWEPLPFQTKSNPGTAGQKKSRRDFFKGGARGSIPATPRATRDSVGDNSGIPSSRVTPTGYFEASGVPYRHPTCDSGTAISCLVDIDPSKLPAGTDTSAALAIVQSALDAWSGVSSLKFKIEGTTSFGTSPKNIDTPDGKIRIQLHDSYNAIASTSTLGNGGSTITGPDYIGTPGSAGTIDGQPFVTLTQGYVILNHRSASMADPEVFAEVLTHEIGHALGLAHSSTDSNEPEPLLEDATMYYTSHGDGRGAAVRDYDVDRIQFGYPLDTPPFSMNRTLRAVIATSGNPKPLNTDPQGPGVDRITVTGDDLQGSPLTVNLISGDQFTLSGNSLIFTSPGNYSDTTTLTPEQIADGNYYFRALFTLSDGVNQSAFYRFDITGFQRDSYPADGLPNTWIYTYFGDFTVGAPGSDRHPDSDPDGDGLDNRTERYLGTDPTDPASGPAGFSFDLASRSVTLTPLRFAPYIIESSADFSSWTTRAFVSTFDVPAPVVTPVDEAPEETRMFYRARMEP